MYETSPINNVTVVVQRRHGPARSIDAGHARSASAARKKEKLAAL